MDKWAIGMAILTAIVMSFTISFKDFAGGFGWILTAICLIFVIFFISAGELIFKKKYQDKLEELKNWEKS